MDNKAAALGAVHCSPWQSQGNGAQARQVGAPQASSLPVAKISNCQTACHAARQGNGAFTKLATINLKKRRGNSGFKALCSALGHGCAARQMPLSPAKPRHQRRMLLPEPLANDLGAVSKLKLRGCKHCLVPGMQKCMPAFKIRLWHKDANLCPFDQTGRTAT